ncbi:hypothetical protein [Thermococcus sp.]
MTSSYSSFEGRGWAFMKLFLGQDTAKRNNLRKKHQNSIGKKIIVRRERCAIRLWEKE